MSEMFEVPVMPDPLLVEVAVPGTAGRDGEPGEPGDPGPPGASILYGEGPPEDLEPVVPGSTYVDTLSANLWGTSDGIEWEFKVTLQGPKGDPGPAEMADFENINFEFPPADGSFLRWDVNTGKWTASWSGDHRNFRGDWQDPVDTLIFSDNFEAIPDRPIFDHLGASQAIVESPTVQGTNSNYPKCTRLEYTSSSERYSTLRTDEIGLIARYISRVEFEWAINIQTQLLSSSYKAGFRVGADIAVDYNNANGGPTIIGWHSYSYNIAGMNPTIRWHGSAESTGSKATYIYVTGLKVYGAANNADLYARDDVVRHQGNFYRSLFDNNTEEPGTGSQWLLIGDL